ncbi:unnamed protein product [Umbelopsis ramanniana]
MKIIFIALAFIFCTVSALVYTPKVTSPNSTSVWQAGRRYAVTWDVNSAGVPIPDDEQAMLYLGYIENNDQYNEHLFWKLASGFKLNTGHQEVVIPRDVKTRNSYIMVLIGDSGNASPQFTIDSIREHD